jgi:hypothetical protein
MSPDNIQNSPAPPSLMKSLTAGFDAISNHIGLIVFSVALDLMLWFGPRLNLGRIFQPANFSAMIMPEMQDGDMVQILQNMVTEFNLFSVLRTLPVGIPSLMAGRAPLETPIGKPLVWELPSIGTTLSLWLLFVVFGLLIGTLYFSVVAQAAIRNQVSWREAFNQWLWAALQILLLTFAGFIFLFLAIIPFSCLLSLMMVSGIGIGQIALIALIIFAGLLIWLLIPLVFSPHGVFVNRYALWISMRESIRLTRWTLPTTSLLLLSILLLSEGLDLLWSLPAENSWWTFVGIIGHAFVSTSLLAASFVYYKDADRWVQQAIRRAKPSIA